MVPIDSTARAGRWPGDTPITPGDWGGPGGSRFSFCVIVATRLRKGSTNSARGAARLVAVARRPGHRPNRGAAACLTVVGG